ncbi:MAG: hypothetical protein M3381_08685, partial [Actinomycetota bacterium]|nr:hypothetical protein [Actinomycetota bacterium]
MWGHCTPRNARKTGTLVGALLLLAAIMAGPALAQVGLPPSYDVQKVDPPNRQVGGGFGSGAASAGDVNGDGKDDFLAYQLAGSPGNDGEVYVISGATGERIDTIYAPDPDPDATGLTGTNNDNEANFGFPWLSKVGTNQGSSPGEFTDLASCPGASPTTDPDKPLCGGAVGPPDGIPDILVGARGVDAQGRTDAGRVYVFDGRTRALLKRIDMPPEDVTDLALGDGKRKGGVWFGRTAVNPAGQPGCEGNSSVGPCQPVSRAVQIGDMDADGRPDLVVGASATSEDPSTAHPNSECASASADAFCSAQGRAYIYRGEDIVGSSPAEILDGSGSNETVKRLKNLYAQSAGGSGLFANSLAPIGDVGSCTAPGIGAGDLCPAGAVSAAPDGKPDIVVGALRTDLPFDSPGGALQDAGVSHVVDGVTGAVLRTYQSPDPQGFAVFGSQFLQPAGGDMGEDELPDAYIPAAAHNTDGAPTGGRGWVFSGNPTDPNPLISTIADPTPHEAENFGYAAVGVGDLVGGADAPRNELLVASEGPFFTAPGGFAPDPPPNDLHFFNGATGRVL